MNPGGVPVAPGAMQNMGGFPRMPPIPQGRTNDVASVSSSTHPLSDSRYIIFVKRKVLLLPSRSNLQFFF